MSEDKNEAEDPFYTLKLFNSIQEIREKYCDNSLTEEERRQIWEEGLPIWNEINKLVNERKSKKPLDLEEIEEKLNSMEIPESDRLLWEKLLSLKKELDEHKEYIKNEKKNLK